MTNTPTPDDYSDRNAKITEDYMADPSATLRSLAKKYDLTPERIRMIVVETTGLSPAEITKRRTQVRIDDVIEAANARLDEDETITRSSDLFLPLGVSNDFVRAHKEQLSDVLDRIKLRRHINDNKARNKYSDDDILNAIRRAYKRATEQVEAEKEAPFKYFTMPLYVKYREADDPTRATVVSRMNWNEACSRINEFAYIKPRGMKSYISKDDALDALQACADDLNKNPMLVTVADYNEWYRSHKERPYVLSIRKLFGRHWRDAGIALAERNAKSNPPVAHKKGA